MPIFFFFLFSAGIFASETEVLVDKILSVFENDTPLVQYCYIKDIHDGRGFTAGKAGFTTATGDFYELILRYHKKNSDSPFIPFEKILKQRSLDHDPSVAGLEELVPLWEKECVKEKFTITQDDLVEDLYKIPARDYQRQLGLSTPLSYLIIYDSVIQHGDGDDPDSFQGILNGMSNRPQDEKTFLSTFLDSRKRILLNSHDPATRMEWRKSVDRVRALQRILTQGNFNLETPLKLRVWGEDWNF